MAGPIDPHHVTRMIRAYPAVFVSNQFGGTDVFFPNFPRGQATGLNFTLALAAAQTELNRQLVEILRDGLGPPTPSDPESLLLDEEERPGTKVLMIEPDKDVILERLGISPKNKPASSSGKK